MKNLLCISLVVFFIIVGCAFQKAWSDDLLTRDQAITVLNEQVIITMAGNLDYYMAFCPQDMLESGDTVETAYSGTDSYNNEVYTTEGPIWFFFVDTDKWAKFAHLVYFVYIDASKQNPTLEDGIVVHKHDFWPKINGVFYLKSIDDRFTTTDLVYGEVPTEMPPED